MVVLTPAPKDKGYSLKFATMLGAIGLAGAGEGFDINTLKDLVPAASVPYIIIAWIVVHGAVDVARVLKGLKR